MAQCDPKTLLSNAACFACLSPGEWQILEIQLLCEILNALGTGISGVTGVYNGHGGPGGLVPAGTAALYYDLDTQTLYQWNPGNSTWN